MSYFSFRKKKSNQKKTYNKPEIMSFFWEKTFQFLKTMVLVSILCVICVVKASAEEKVNTVELSHQGNEFFRQANLAAQSNHEKAKSLYAKAVMRFERIVKEGKIENGKLYYNIGNTYFRMNDLGRAILNYRRAEKYLSNDQNLRQNLDYARSHRQDKIEVKQKTIVLKTLLFLHYDLTARTRSIIFAVCFFLFWLAASIRLFSRKSAPQWLMVSLGFASVMFFISLTISAVMESKTRNGVILAEEIMGRKGDSQTYQPSFKEPLHAGTEFKLTEKRNHWLQIELNDGRECWIPGKAAELL